MNQIEQTKLIQQYDRLMHKVLYQLNITPAQCDYEDYLQILRIHLWQKCDKYETLAEFQQIYSVNYLWQSLSWCAQDYRRHLLKLPIATEEVALSFLIDKKITSTKLDDKLIWQYFLVQLTPRQQQQLLDLYNKKGSRQMQAYYRKKLKQIYETFTQIM